MFKLPKATLYILPLVASMGLTACFGEYRHNLIPANVSTFSKAYEERADDMREALSETQIVFDLSRFVDRRVPEAYSTYAPHIVLHTYDPDTLPGTAPAFIRAVMDETLAMDMNEPSNSELREIFFELRNVDMRILNGNLISGEFGRYYTRIEADIKVRNSQGEVLLDKPYEMELETMRQSFNGMQPDIDTDWHRITRTLKTAIHNLAFDIMNDTLESTGQSSQDGKLKNLEDFPSPDVFSE
jgi:hypothetical protein